MTSQQLFIEFLHRLRKYSDAVVLHALLQQHGDEVEFKTSATQMALDILGGVVVRRQIQHALDRLSHFGLLEVHTHTNYRTHVKVDREAVKALLRIPVSPLLPGIRTDGFPFLEHINATTVVQEK